MKLVFALAAVFALMAGCSSGGGDGAGGGSAEDKARWPGTGNYDYSMTYNGCKVEYHASSQADLCGQLQDQSLDHCAALDSRMSVFSNQCGGEFEPRNMKSVTIDGWDDYLQRRCTVQSSSTFARKSDYCGFLADESRHDGCFWSERLQEFQKYSCAGDFSQQPTRVQPAPPPQPQPQPQPQPGNPTQPGQPTQPPRDPYAKLVADYAAIGIKISKQGRSTPTLPGRPTYWDMLNTIVPVVDQLLPEFQHAKFKISSITLNEYTAYSSGRLDLSVSMTEPELRQFISLQEKSQNITNLSGIEIDYGISVFASLGANQLGRFESSVDWFADWQRLGKLKILHKLVDRITLTDKHYMNFYNRTYELNDDTMPDQMQKDFPVLLSLSQISNVVYDDFIDMDGNVAGLTAFATWASGNSQALSEASHLNKGMKIKASPENDNIFFGTDLEIGMKTFKPSQGLAALLKVAPVINRLGVEFDMDGVELKDNLVKGANLVISHEASVKKLKLTKIEFYDGDSEVIGTELLVGNNDSVQKFEKALSQK